MNPIDFILKIISNICILLLRKGKSYIKFGINQIFELISVNNKI